MSWSLTSKQNYNSDNSRDVSIAHVWNNYDASSTVGSTYLLAIWSVKSRAPTDPSKVTFTFQDQNGKPITGSGLSGSYDTVRGVLSVEVPTALVPNWAGPNAGTNRDLLVVHVTGLGA